MKNHEQFTTALAENYNIIFTIISSNKRNFMKTFWRYTRLSFYAAIT
jgi:hypothetical protein